MMADTWKACMECGQPLPQEMLEFEGLKLDLETNDVIFPEPLEHKRHISRAEARILELLMRKRGHVAPVGWLADEYSDSDAAETTLKVQICHLRKRLTPYRIETIWGVGYRLVAP